MESMREPMARVVVVTISRARGIEATSTTTAKESESCPANKDKVSAVDNIRHVIMIVVIVMIHDDCMEAKESCPANVPSEIKITVQDRQWQKIIIAVNQ